MKWIAWSLQAAQHAFQIVSTHGRGFSGSIWQALCILIPLALFVFVAEFISFRRRGPLYYFDPRHTLKPKKITLRQQKAALEARAAALEATITRIEKEPDSTATPQLRPPTDFRPELENLKVEIARLGAEDEEAGDYGPHMQRYQDLFKLLITLSAGAIAFLINTKIGEKAPLSSFAQNVSAYTPIVVGFFGFAIASSILFITLQNLFYETYSHSVNHDTFTAWRYALSTSCATTGLSSFVIAFAWLAAGVFS